MRPSHEKEREGCGGGGGGGGRIEGHAVSIEKRKREEGGAFGLISSCANTQNIVKVSSILLECLIRCHNFSVGKSCFLLC